MVLGHMAAPPDDRTLLRAWKDGDTRSGEALFERHYAALERFFLNKASHDHADLVQRTFLACVEKADTLRDEGSFRAFLFGIARYELLNFFRRKDKQMRVDDFSEQSSADLDPTPSQVLVDKREQRLLLEALRRIPLDLQIVLELSYWEDMTGPEIAEAVSLPEGTVRSRLRRARQLLDEQLSALADSPDLLQSTTANLDRWVAEVRARV